MREAKNSYDIIMHPVLCWKLIGNIVATIVWKLSKVSLRYFELCEGKYSVAKNSKKKVQNIENSENNTGFSLSNFIKAKLMLDGQQRDNDYVTVERHIYVKN